MFALRRFVVIMFLVATSFGSGQELTLFGVAEPHCGPPFQVRLRLVGAIEGTVIVDVHQSGPELNRKDAFDDKIYTAAVRLCSDDGTCSSDDTTKIHFSRSSGRGLRGEFVVTLPRYGIVNIHFRTELPDGKTRHIACE